MNTLARARLGLDAAWRARLAALAGSARRTQDAVPARRRSRCATGSTSAARQPARLLGFDQALVWVVVALLALGLVMVYCASVALPDSPKFARYAPTHFLTRHVLSDRASRSWPRWWWCRSR